MLRHDERHRRAAACQHVDEDRQRLLQRDPHGAVILHAPRIDELGHRLSDGLPCGPAGKAGSTVLGANRLAVVESQAVPQADQIGSAVVGHGVTIGHLRMRVERIVDAEQRVIDGPTMVHGNGGRGEDRV
jgi:hypothetical protein